MNSRKATEVASFRVVQAVKHAKDHGDSRPPPVVEELSPVAISERKSRIGKTALPTRREIHCYLCEYVFPLSGRTDKLVCPKCRHTLDQTNYTIDDSGSLTIRTTCRVHITESGSLTGASITAQDVTIHGSIEGTTITAWGHVELGGCLKLDAAQLKTKDIRISESGSVRIEHPASFHNVDIAGKLTAQITVSGQLTIRSGGQLAGKISTRHLNLEDGGALNARVELGVVK